MKIKKIWTELIPFLFLILCGSPVPGTLPIGGQAVIEGVLMKGPRQWGLSVRTPEGTLWKKKWEDASWTHKGLWKYPFIRGIAVMAEMLRVGMKALSVSANVALGEEESFSFRDLLISIIVAVFAVVALFIALPVWVADRATALWALSPVGKNVLEGLIRGGVFVLYVALLGVWNDMRRVFAYHGAEHKTVNAYEQGAPMDPEVIANYSRIHRRCGTSFLLVVVVVSIFVFALAGNGPFWWRALSRVLLLPFVIGISYEFIRFASHSKTWGRWLIMPALSLQYLTTREPEKDQIEVAISALQLALEGEEGAWPDSIDIKSAVQ